MRYACLYSPLISLIIDLHQSIALFFSAASLSGAFSGLLAAAIQNMHGIGGKPGWAWIFIIVRFLFYLKLHPTHLESYNRKVCSRFW